MRAIRIPQGPSSLNAPGAALHSPRYSTDSWDRKTGAPSRKSIEVESHNRRTGDGAPPPAPEDEAAIRSLSRDATVLEYGPGTGDALPALSAAVTHGRIFVVDQSADVVRILGQEFGEERFRFIEGSRPNSMGEPPGIVDYMRARKVAPYLDPHGMRNLFEDAEHLVKPGGTLFFTSYHESQSRLEGFNLHSLAQTIDIAGGTTLKARRVEVAIFGPREVQARETFELALDDVTPERIKELDQHINERRACHGDPIEVEMRFYFGKVSPKTSEDN